MPEYYPPAQGLSQPNAGPIRRRRYSAAKIQPVSSISYLFLIFFYFIDAYKESNAIGRGDRPYGCVRPGGHRQGNGTFRGKVPTGFRCHYPVV